MLVFFTLFGGLGNSINCDTNVFEAGDIVGGVLSSIVKFGVRISTFLLYFIFGGNTLIVSGETELKISFPIVKKYNF